MYASNQGKLNILNLATSIRSQYYSVVFFTFSINKSELTKCKLDQIAGPKQYYSVLLFLLFLSFGHFWSSGFLFIRSSGFSLLDQLSKFNQDLDQRDNLNVFFGNLVNICSDFLHK